jgi:hypothetical protein
MTVAAATAKAAEEIEATLTRCAEQLAAGDIEAAAAAAQRLADVCWVAQGQLLDPAQVARLRALWQHCMELADSASGTLNASLQRFSVSDRARKAYGDR